jgi:hypothetical protein
MKRTIRNLLLVSCFFFAVSYDSCSSGVNYDKKYKLHPETASYSCTMETVYGKRWERLGFATFSIGTILSFSAFIVWRRKQRSEPKSILNLMEE